MPPVLVPNAMGNNIRQTTDTIHINASTTKIMPAQERNLADRSPSRRSVELSQTLRSRPVPPACLTDAK